MIAYYIYLTANRISFNEITPHFLSPQVVQESVPIPLDGHAHEIEGLVADGVGNLVVSLCLEGFINTWDSYTGENLATIDRTR